MPNITQIPAQRIRLVEPQSGFITREWYRYLEQTYNTGGIGSEYYGFVEETRQDFIFDNTTRHVVVAGRVTVRLQAAGEREGIVTITNAGDRTIIIQPDDDETINGESTLELDFKWTSVQLLPVRGGYVII